MEGKLGTAGLRRLKEAIVIISWVIAAGWTQRTQAQGANFAAPSLRSDAKVSMRELQVPAKARDELERGLRRLAKRDAIGSLRHFDAAIRVSPEYYKAYSKAGTAAMQLPKNAEPLRRFPRASDR